MTVWAQRTTVTRRKKHSRKRKKRAKPRSTSTSNCGTGWDGLSMWSAIMVKGDSFRFFSFFSAAASLWDGVHAQGVGGDFAHERKKVTNSFWIQRQHITNEVYPGCMEDDTFNAEANVWFLFRSAAVCHISVSNKGRKKKTPGKTVRMQNIPP